MTQDLEVVAERARAVVTNDRGPRPATGSARGTAGRLALLGVLVMAIGPGTSAEAARGDRMPGGSPRVVVLVSADAEWKALRALRPEPAESPSPFGAWFVGKAGARSVLYFHGGWGKIAAAGSTQYAIDRWKPALLINIGTCGGFQGAIEKGEVLLVEKTVVYDIVELMGDSAEAIAAFTTPIDLGWLGRELPPGVRRGALASADRDLQPADLERLAKAYGALAGDWESGAIAWVARRNGVRLLILRGVSDVVGAQGSETYGNLEAFEAGSGQVMKRLVDDLPFWLSASGIR